MQQISPDTLISDVLTSHPGAVSVFSSFGLGCPACMGAEMETLRSVASMHEVPIEELIRALEALPSSDDEGAHQ